MIEIENNKYEEQKKTKIEIRRAPRKTWTSQKGSLVCKKTVAKNDTYCNNKKTHII